MTNRDPWDIRLSLSSMLEFQDPVTGSVHCALAAYWSKKLGKCDFVAYQVHTLSLSLSLSDAGSSFINCIIYLTQASPRGGVINLHLDEKRQRVLLRGKAVTVMEGSLLC